MRDSFVMYRSFYDAVSELDDTDRLAVLDAICKYALDGTEPEQKGTVSGMFKLIRPQIDANNKRYENGKRGATKPEPNRGQTVTKPEPNLDQTVTKPEPNGGQTEGKADPNVKCNMLNDNDLKDKNHCPADVSKIVDHLNLKTGAHYLSSSEKTRSLIKARLREGFKVEDFYTVIDKKVAEWKETDMAKYLRPETLFGTKFEGYLNQSVKPRAAPVTTNVFTNFEQRDYDYDALERALLKRGSG